MNHCRKNRNILCDFRTNLDNDEVLIERCIHCGEKVSYNKKNGITDDKRYRREHKQDLLQPFGSSAKEFERVYGKVALKKAQEEAKGYHSIYDDKEGMGKEIKDRAKNKKTFSLK